MTSARAPGYAIVLAAAFVLWLPVALFGAQGFSGLLGLIAIAAVFFAPLLRTNLTVVAIFALAIWAAASSLWSPESGVMVAGNLSKGNFSVDAAGLRILLTVLAGTLTLAAALRIPPGRGRLSLLLVSVMLALHGIITVATGLLPDVTLNAYAPFSDRVKEAPQNILRSANAYLLGLPILLGIACAYAGAARVGVCLVLLAVSFSAFLFVGSDVALLGIITISISIGVVMIFVEIGYKLLLIAIAVLIFASPVILGIGGAELSKTNVPLPASVQSRVWAWQLTTEKIIERPVLGHGIEASKEWRDTFGENPDLLQQMVENTGIDDGRWQNYRILPGHPHNMGLQIWAETGLVGVTLAILALMLIAWKLPPPVGLTIQSRVAVAAMIGASFALFSLSYSVWNEAFWATIAVAAAGVILLDRATR